MTTGPWEPPTVEVGSAIWHRDEAARLLALVSEDATGDWRDAEFSFAARQQLIDRARVHADLAKLLREMVY